MKTAELTGKALNLVVTMLEGGHHQAPIYPKAPRHYSTDWAQGGPIIEREEITVCWQGATWVGSKFNVRVTDEYEFQQTGTTPLVAAMRCYVASKLGDEVNIPKELI